MISTDGITFSPICGKYTVEGSEFQNNGLPLYDGRQLNWVKENIDLSDYLGQNIKLRFSLISDGWLNADGFFVDDIKVLKIVNGVGINQIEKSNDNFVVYPNPASQSINLITKNYDETIQLKYFLTDALGRTVLQGKVQSKQQNIPINQINQGTYFLQLIEENKKVFYQPVFILQD